MPGLLLGSSLQSPRLQLIAGFALWKFLLILLSLLSYGPGYDTSATLLDGIGDSSLLSLIRWDGIYFVETARRGYIFEQEWAFSWTLTRIVSIFGEWLQLIGVSPETASAWAGVLIANMSHFLTVLLLYELSLKIFGPNPKTRALSLITAALHIVSPAGIFLSAPNAESPFALFHVLGMLLYTESSLAHRNEAITSDLLLLLSGTSIGIATALRGNGLFSGYYFAYAAVTESLVLLQGTPSARQLRRLGAIVVSGVLVALGFVLPQVVAWQQYCGSDLQEPRPWCSTLPPSIYAFVQEHYWNNGFLRYWTVSNIPLFLLAAPILTIMMRSSIWAFGHTSLAGMPQEVKLRSQAKGVTADATALLRIFAVPQAFLAIYTLMAGHVQIATRLSSGYPIWYWWTAWLFMDEPKRPAEASWNSSRIVTRWMVLYALIQAGLYASFLPPA